MKFLDKLKKDTKETDKEISKGFVPFSEAELSQKTFDDFKKLIYTTSGISLSEKKRALLMSRLGKRMRLLKIQSFKDYYEFVKADKSGDELISLIDVISTNVTEFYRESNHFQIIKDKLDEWKGQNQKKFRFWSAACSSGEEPFTMLMLADALANSSDINFKILATDISTKILTTAGNCTYIDAKTHKIPKELKNKYFDKLRLNDVINWKVKNKYRKLVSFNRLNLSTPPFPMKGPFDIIFCRNVMIYFDNRVRQALVDQIWQLLRPNGLFLIGQAESLNALDTKFKMIRPSLYVKS